MCGIFAYLNHLTPKTRKEVLDILIAGLKRLEYRGYDSAGVGVDGSTNESSTVLVKSTGKGKKLSKHLTSCHLYIHTSDVFNTFLHAFGMHVQTV